MRRRVIAVSAVIGVGLLVALALAFFVSPYASSQPDGLSKVAIDKGFADRESEHLTADSPLAGYSTKGVDDDKLSTGLAGVAGVAVTFAVGTALVFGMKALRRRSAHGDGTPACGPALAAGGDGIGGP